VAVIGVTALVIVAAAATTWAVTNQSGASYRTAVVQRGSVEQTLTTTGELSPIDSAIVDFQVAGTVARVRTAVGHRVVAGQTLARLDRAALQATLSSARSELTNARQRLSEDEASEDGTAPSTTTTTTAGGSATTAAASFDAARPTVVTAAHPHQPGSLTHDQDAVRAAQRATDAALATARTALSAETTACAAELSSTSSTSRTSSTPLSCSDAAHGLLHDQTVVNNDERAEDAAEQTLSRDLSAAEKAFAQQQKSGASTTATQRHTTSRSTSAGSTLTTVTAADIATDQATIDQARAQVATASESLGQATLTAPISGKVTAVTISKGDTVTGSSSATQPAVEIVGSRQDKATVFLSDTQVRTMTVGLAARVTPDGSSRPVTGRVVAIGVSGTESSSGSVSYPVTVDIAASATPLVSGADAAVSIRLATAGDVIAVPTSAVHYQGTATYVEVLRSGKPARQTVHVATVGPALTEVVSGLTVGQRVVLADLDAAVPSSSTMLTGRAGVGGFGAGGGFAGGRGGFGAGAGRTFVSP
jgi:RND family efflux transporter MFP subunit